MAAPVFGVLTSVVGVGLLVSCAALAGSGRVYFQGAVVEPTCHSAHAERLAAANPGAAVRRVACVDAAAATAAPASMVQAYSLQVLPLSAVPAEQLLAPFDRYAEDNRPQDVDQVLVRVYE